MPRGPTKDMKRKSPAKKVDGSPTKVLKEGIIWLDNSNLIGWVRGALCDSCKDNNLTSLCRFQPPIEDGGKCSECVLRRMACKINGVIQPPRGAPRSIHEDMPYSPPSDASSYVGSEPGPSTLPTRRTGSQPRFSSPSSLSSLPRPDVSPEKARRRSLGPYGVTRSRKSGNSSTSNPYPPSPLQPPPLETGGDPSHNAPERTPNGLHGPSQRTRSRRAETAAPDRSVGSESGSGPRPALQSSGPTRGHALPSEYDPPPRPPPAPLKELLPHPASPVPATAGLQHRAPRSPSTSASTDPLNDLAALPKRPSPTTAGSYHPPSTSTSASAFTSASDPLSTTVLDLRAHLLDLEHTDSTLRSESWSIPHTLRTLHSRKHAIELERCSLSRRVLEAECAIEEAILDLGPEDERAKELRGMLKELEAEDGVLREESWEIQAGVRRGEERREEIGRRRYEIRGRIEDVEDRIEEALLEGKGEGDMDGGTGEVG
ncbi:hypothetical protein FPV67DRAFT_1664095 [Lyophyllum atratum]|nr:hypothetical protein FPV67DRAFT_1664095 [Lyophyllum atratum]